MCMDEVSPRREISATTISHGWGEYSNIETVFLYPAEHNAAPPAPGLISTITICNKSADANDIPPPLIKVNNSMASKSN